MSNFLSSFTPSLMSPEALEAIFVQREELAARLVEDVRASCLTGAKHQSLVVGPRGMGKTHLVALIYHRIKADAELRDRVVVAWLNEEEWGLTSYIDLMVRVLQALDRELPEPRLSASIDDLLEQPEEQAITRAESLLREELKGRTLLLLIENLDEVFKGLGAEGQRRLRSLIQEQANCSVLATTQSLFAGVRLRTSPFYGFFRTYHLDELSFGEAAELLSKVAAHQGDTELDAFVRSPRGRARVRALRHLAGGNPRVYVIFSRFLTPQALDDLVMPFMQMLDELTPYYQSRLTFLTPQQRKIVDLLCDYGGALPVKEIARQGRMTHQTASGQLAALRELGYVQADTLGRESFYELREPLMRLVVEVKKNRGGTIQTVVEFLRLWYTTEELEQRKSLVGDGAALERLHLDEAIRAARAQKLDPRLAASLRDRDYLLSKRDYEAARCAAEEVLEYRGTPHDWLSYFSSLNGEYDLYPQVVDDLERRLANLPPTPEGHTSRGLGLQCLGRWEDSIAAFNRAIALSPDSYLSYVCQGWSLLQIGRYEESLQSIDRAFALNPDDPDTCFVRVSVLSLLARFEEVISATDRLMTLGRIDEDVCLMRGYSLRALERHEEALAAFDEAIRCDPRNSWAYHGRGLTLYELGRIEASLIEFGRVQEYEPKNEAVRRDQAWALFRLSRYEEAAVAFKNAIEFEPDDFGSRSGCGWSFFYLHQYEAAISEFNDALEIEQADAWIYLGLGWALTSLGRYEEAVVSFDHAICIDPELSYAYQERGAALDGLGRDVEAQSSFALHDWLMADSTDGRLEAGELRCPIGLTVCDRVRALALLLLPPAWSALVPRLIKNGRDQASLSELSEALVRLIPEATSPVMDQAKATTWLNTWKAAASGEPALRLALRLMEAALIYRESGDRRVLLALPTEERQLLLNVLEPAGETQAN